MSLSHFQEKAGVVTCPTEWGSWSQSFNEVNIEVNLPLKCKSKELNISITNRSISCTVLNKLIFQGQLFSFIHVDDSTWSLEDGNFIRIIMSKAKSSQVWPFLMADGTYSAPPQIFLEMKKQTDLEMFQIQYPGMDFSQAKLQKCYDTLK